MRDNFARENDWPNDLKYRAIFTGNKRLQNQKSSSNQIPSRIIPLLPPILFFPLSNTPETLQYSRPFRDLFSQGRPSLPSPSVRPPHNRTSIERQWKVDVQFSMFSKDSSPFSPTRGTRLQRCRCLAGVKSKEYRFGMCVGGCWPTPTPILVLRTTFWGASYPNPDIRSADKQLLSNPRQPLANLTSLGGVRQPSSATFYRGHPRKN